MIIPTTITLASRTNNSYKNKNHNNNINKTEVESVQLGNTYIADMDKCHQDKRCLDKCQLASWNLF